MSLSGLTISTLEGVWQSLFNPTYITNVIKRESDEIKTAGSREFFPERIAEFGGYVAPLAFYLENIVQNPTNPLSYVPLVTNTLGGLLILDYSNFKKKDNFITG